MAITVDQATIGGSSALSSDTTIAFTTSAAVASSGFIALSYGWWCASTATITSISGGGLTWVVAKQARAATGNPHSGVAYAQAPSGLASSTTITAKLDTSSFARIVGGISFLGVATSSPVDTTDGPDTIAGATAWTTGNVSLTAGSVLVSASQCEAAASSTAVTGTEFVDRSETNNTMVGHYQIATSAGNYVNAGTWDAATDGVTNAAAFLAGVGFSAGGRGVVRPTRHRGRYPSRDAMA
jgi:hypothetical protein